MRSKIPIITASALVVSLHAMDAAAQTPAHIWSSAYGTSGTQTVGAMAANSTLLWAAGSLNGSINLGGSTFSDPLEVFLAQFSADGVHQWSKAFGSNNNAGISALAVDASSNVYLTGQFGSTIDFGGGVLTSLGGQDVYIAKFNSAGTHQWSKRFGDVALNQTGMAITIDNANNVIIAGRAQGTVDFGGGALTSAGGMDAFVAKFNSAGTHQWSKFFGDAVDQQLTGVASASGDVYLAGDFSGVVNFGGGNLTSAGLKDACLVKLNSAGVHQWSKSFGDANWQYGIDVDVDAFSVILVGNFQGGINLGGGVLTSAGSQDVYVARFNASGTHQWSKQFGDSDTQSASAVDLSGGHFYVSGYFEGSLDFGDHPLTAAGSDAFIAKLAAFDGNDAWSQHYGSIDSDYGLDVQSTSTRTYLGGYFNDDIDFGHGDPLFSPARDGDAFIAAFGSNPAEPVISSVVDLPNDQGGVVTVSFVRSDYDAATTPVVIRRYELYLREDPLPAVSGAAAAPAGESWLLAGESPAHGLGGYSTLATTEADSTLTGGMHTSVFKVRAVTDDPAVYFDSPLLGGFSLDNLVPGLPENLVLEKDVLSWRSPADTDIAHYSVYGSDGAFNESAVLIDYATGTRLELGGRSYANYFVTATDRSGNEGRAASLHGSPGGARQTPATLSVSAFPNPFNPETTLRYTLPSTGAVRIEIFDAAGARVRLLVDEDRAAGAYTARWDGRNGSGGVVGSGVYFARIQHGGATRAYKMVMLK